jgi:serine protein kinase
MPSYADSNQAHRRENFLKSLVAYTKEHKASHWAGPLSEFLEKVLPANPIGVARTSHQYIWDMIRWQGIEDELGTFRCKLFDDELFGTTTPSAASSITSDAATGSEVERRRCCSDRRPGASRRSSSC